MIRLKQMMWPILGTLLLTLLLSMAGYGGYMAWQQLFPGYDSHLTQKEYSQVALHQNVNLVFYKQGCPYCKAGKQAVVAAAAKNNYPTFYIDVESSEGQELVEKYQVKKAATVLIVRDGEVTSYLYAKRDDHGKILVDSEKIKEAFNG